MITVKFTYLTGLKRPVFTNGRLAGSWDGWLEHTMQAITCDDGCPGFAATLPMDDSLAGQTVRWGVRADGPQGANLWAVNLEVPDPVSSERYRELTLPGPGGAAEARYHFTHSRYLGAQKYYRSPDAPASIRFAVWAPNARRVDVVFGLPDSGYIWDDGSGIDHSRPEIALEPKTGGIWESPGFELFADFGGAPYMFRIVNAQGATVYRTDIHSRWQVGRGDRDPNDGSWDGSPTTLDGGVSCSMVIDQDLVRENFLLAESDQHVTDEEFWATELTAGRCRAGWRI